MDKYIDFEQLLEESINHRAGEIEVVDRFAQIKESIESHKGKRAYQLKSVLYNLKHLQIAAAAICCLIVSFSLSFCFSPGVRAVAYETIDRVKTIFIMDKVEGEYQVVEKPSSAKVFSPEVSSTTNLSDEEIERKVGYKAVLPPNAAGYVLGDKVMSVFVQENIDYVATESLWQRLQKAINDDEELEKLKDYNPARRVYGVYQKEAHKVFIETYKSEFRKSQYLNAASEKESVKIGEVDGTWIGFPLPDYPQREDQGYGVDISRKPTSVITHHILMWSMGGIDYAIIGNKNDDLTQDEAIKIAHSFIEGQKQYGN